MNAGMMPAGPSQLAQLGCQARPARRDDDKNKKWQQQLMVADS